MERLSARMALTQIRANQTKDLQARRKKEKMYLAGSEYEEEFDSEVWENTPPKDIWVFDKLIVARLAGHKCGPRGSMVPIPGDYFVRPITNTFGMGLMARIQRIEGYAEDMHPAEFWCEIFNGRHISVDYENGKQILAVEGSKHDKSPFQRFTKWWKVNDQIDLPPFLHDLSTRHRYINCEFIDGKLIEVHFRRNPDFKWGNSIMIPKWLDEGVPDGSEGMRYVPDNPGCPSLREGVFIA